MRFAPAVAILVIGCSSKLAQPGGQVQPDGQVQDACSFSAYRAPGCGQNAVLEAITCGPDSACITPVCTCDGQTMSTGCGYSTVPFASFGPCEDAAADGFSDGASDAPIYPLCSFVSPGTGLQCNLAECIPAQEVGADANSPTCGDCPNGYACAVYCPTPLGGCGAPYRCCRTQ
jgi:hypothetical protein